MILYFPKAVDKICQQEIIVVYILNSQGTYHVCTRLITDDVTY